MTVDPGCPNHCGLASPCHAMRAAGNTKYGSSAPGAGRSCERLRRCTKSDRAMIASSAATTSGLVVVGRGTLGDSSGCGVSMLERWIDGWGPSIVAQQSARAIAPELLRLITISPRVIQES